MTYSEDYRKRHYNSDHTVKNGRLQNNGLMLRSGEEDTIINQKNFGVLNTTFSFGVRLDQNRSVQMLSYKSVDLDGLFFSEGLSVDGTTVINTKGTNAKVVQRLVAYFDITDSLDFTNLSGITIVSYEGSAVLSISGNSIVATGGAGTAWDILLSDGTDLPCEGSVYDISGGGNHPSNNNIKFSCYSGGAFQAWSITHN